MASPNTRPLHDLEARELAAAGRRLRDSLDPREWSAAGPSGRRRLALAANDLVRREYGLEPLRLRFGTGWPAERLGRFDIPSGAISVNRDLLLEPQPSRLLATIAHENRHAVQELRLRGGLATPGYARSELATWVQAEEAYGLDNFWAYHYNALEVDAREAAHALVDDGFWAVERERALSPARLDGLDLELPTRHRGPEHAGPEEEVTL